MIRNRSTRFILPAVLLLGALGGVGNLFAADPQDGPRAITWLGYNEALAQGRDFDKPVFIHFTAPWCKWCKKMQRETYTDPRVIGFLDDNFTAVMVDTEKLPALARKFRVESLPTLWFLDSGGKGLTSIQGFVGPDKLLRVMEYVSTKAYVDTDYQTWVRKHPGR
jgi:thioredoxin-related protein